MVSIKDIAKKAGVSISTVSYALNGNPKVTQETSARILAIAKELNYIPNAAARNLKKRETKILGVFLTDYSGAFYGQLLQGMRETLSQKGYELIVCSGKRSHLFLPERMIDGAIILDETLSDEELLQYADLGHKLVVLDRELDHPNISQVLLDNKAGATLAINHLIDKGHRKIYVLTGPKGTYDSIQRLNAVRQAASRHPDIDFTEIEGNFIKSSGEKAAKQILEESNQPVAVFCLNDEMAIGIYDYLSNTDYKVGKDIHIIGFDNIEVSNYVHPRLATIDYSKWRWGAVGSEQLLKLIANEPVEHERIYVTVIEGESVTNI
ncbi:LacI family DNA-binding transcriptional regulator [Metabacillus sediminilitoris]|uniref:LacI family transcriptional regulator n=1 Tax=Metabacillus sediminilitoris TaxID=2567941 RepID=A0A4S4C174_9BACI|nr:LacI family DNA-binding transcriptional regulator [Metabacillus sediminilitoris]QGQ48251.1 LacI family DNA-binding transcriptional regulator [Metabacillus sediminilitoris]THF81391.1 LacI family transcriptional regulator [Metabacillus sediminilitoris]